ncbi:MAG: M13 family metallopeptidase [Bacteroidales bacterium]|nr:M13 family metallopeptidase [Candidatus Cacconaster caballi]
MKHNTIKRMAGAAILFSLVMATVISTGCKGEAGKTSGMNYEIMDTTARAGDDFARYATGHWIDHNPQPPEYTKWGVMAKLSDDNVKILSDLFRKIASEPHKKGTVEQKIGDLYNMVLDTVRIGKEGIGPIQKYLDEIRSLNSREELIALCNREHDNLFFSIFVSPDEKDSDNNIVCIGQGGLSLGNRDYYFADDPQSLAVVGAMKKYMATLFTLAGYSPEEAAAKTSRIWEIETELAQVTYSKEKMRDVEANYHKMSIREITEYCGGFDWDAYLKANRYDRTTQVDFGQPEPIAKGCNLLMTLPLEELKSIYEYRLLKGAAAYLGSDFEDASFEMNKVVTGAKEKAPRWKKAQSIVSDIMSEAVSQIYVAKYFPEQAKAEMLELVGNLQESLADRIKAQEWMCDSTKTLALEKLESFTVKIGYPDKWDDISGLVIDPELPLYENIRRAEEFYWNLQYEKTYNKPVDRDQWYMPAYMVNAYYNPSSNEICFPAGILRAPLFDMNADAASNYGAIGVIIGHEMTHGFDDQGRLYTKEGNMQNWWTEEDAEGFKKPCEQMTRYFDSLWVIPGKLKANGTLTLGENIADHGGLNIGYTAFRKWQEKHGRLADDNGFTPEQRFFLSYARVWAGSITEEMLNYQAKTDVHSTARLRINGALAQCDFWYEAFGISSEDSLYVAPEARVKVW